MHEAARFPLKWRVNLTARTPSQWTVKHFHLHVLLIDDRPFLAVFYNREAVLLALLYGGVPDSHFAYFAGVHKLC